MKGPFFDQYGCINEETEKVIVDYVGDPQAWLKYCIDCWDQNYGKVVKRSDSIIEFVTGGWSANEMVISAMGKNMVLWLTVWESSHRGGLYRFKIGGDGGEK